LLFSVEDPWDVLVINLQDQMSPYGVVVGRVHEADKTRSTGSKGHWDWEEKPSVRPYRKRRLWTKGLRFEVSRHGYEVSSPQRVPEMVRDLNLSNAPSQAAMQTLAAHRNIRAQQSCTDNVFGGGVPLADEGEYGPCPWISVEEERDESFWSPPDDNLYA